MDSTASGRSASSVHPTWRIGVAVLLAQLPGVVLGLWLSPVGDWFMNSWYGAALAAPFGFVGGLLWQIEVDVNVLRIFRWHVLGYGLFSAALPTFGVLSFDIWAHAVV
jgi:hypothetical protein